MNAKLTLLLMCFLAPLLAGADPLEEYGKLTGKTVLIQSALPFLPDAIISDLPTEKTNAIAKIESELSKQGVAVVQDGPHLVRIFTETQRDFLKSVPLRGAELAVVKSQARIGTGEINLGSVDAGTFLSIYAALSGRTVLRPDSLPVPVLHLKTTCPLNREEAVYAMETVLALNGADVVKDGEKFVQVVPRTQRLTVTSAPKPDPAAKLLDPNKLPSMGDSDAHRVTTKIEREFERCQKLLYDFIHYQKPRDRPTRRLLDLYASLAGKTAEPSKNLGGAPIWFHVETPLSEGELLYAIETTFTLNNLAIIPVDDQRIRLGHISELRKGNRDATVQPKR